MEKHRDLSLESYGISNYEYRELMYFCLQYQEKKNVINWGINSINTNLHYINKLKEDVETIEKAAKISDVILAEYIIKSISKGIPYENVRPPCGRRQFYEKRKKFFINLHMIRNKLI